MRTKDYEDAVDALSCSIVLDEVVLRRGEVRRFFGHKDHTLLMWDEMGRCFSTVLHTLAPGTEITDSTHEGVTESCYERETAYDLKF